MTDARHAAIKRTLRRYRAKRNATMRIYEQVNGWFRVESKYFVHDYFRTQAEAEAFCEAFDWEVFDAAQ